jgi:hypothetical protein
LEKHREARALADAAARLAATSANPDVQRALLQVQSRYLAEADQLEACAADTVRGADARPRLGSRTWRG